jgi:hypothetical protein
MIWPYTKQQSLGFLFKQENKADRQFATNNKSNQIIALDWVHHFGNFEESKNLTRILPASQRITEYRAFSEL